MSWTDIWSSISGLLPDWLQYLPSYGSAIRETVLAVLQMLTAYLPDSTGFSQEVINSFARIILTARELSFAIDWQQLFLVFGLEVAFEFILLIYKLVTWIIRIVRG